MDTFASHALEWLGAYTYAVVFVGVLIDASGLPFPGRLLLVAAGALTRTDYDTLLGIIALAVAAAMLMDLAWYVAGRRGGERVIAFYRKLPGWRGRRRGSGTAEAFARYGAASIVISRFFTRVRVLAWPVAAGRGVGYAKFFAVPVTNLIRGRA